MKTKTQKMKRIIIALIISLQLAQFTKAQYYEESVEKYKTQQTFLGFGLSINEYGLGGGAELPLTNKLSAFANVGVGGWGYKIGVGLHIFPKGEPYGSCLGFGYAYATGADDMETELEVKPSGSTEKVTLDLHGASTVNLTYSYYFRVGRGHKIGLVTGYAIPLETEPYTVKTPGMELSEISEQVMEIMQPGGMILGFKFMFAM